MSSWASLVLEHSYQAKALLAILFFSFCICMGRIEQSCHPENGTKKTVLVKRVIIKLH